MAESGGKGKAGKGGEKPSGITLEPPLRCQAQMVSNRHRFGLDLNKHGYSLIYSKSKIWRDISQKAGARAQSEILARTPQDDFGIGKGFATAFGLQVVA